MQTLKIDHLGFPEFQSAPSSKLGLQEVHVYSVSVAAQLHNFKHLMAVLNADELSKAQNYHQEKDFNRFVVSRGIQRVILGRYLSMDAADLIFNVTFNKKPGLMGVNSWLKYNISHSADFILLALSKMPVGADVEYVNSNFNFREVLAGNFNAEEIAYVSAEDSLYRFFQLWTRKEALLKGIGEGLNDRLHEVPSLEGAHQLKHKDNDSKWNLLSLNFGNDYAACIASSEKEPKYKFFNNPTL